MKNKEQVGQKKKTIACDKLKNENEKCEFVYSSKT